MPTYEYHCSGCGGSFDIEQKITADPLKTCPECQSPSLKRGPGGGIGLAFKGTGFYITDYARPEQSNSRKIEDNPSVNSPSSDTSPLDS